MNDDQMKISKFAKLTGISRENLIFYDQQGLLKPKSRAQNGYRYYSQTQLNYAYLITTFRKSGISIKEIKQFNQQQSPELFNQQINEISNQIGKLTTTRDTLKLASQLINETRGDDFNTIALKRLAFKPIYVGPPINHNNYGKANLAFYKDCNQRGINLISPFGMIFNVNDYQDGPKIKIKSCYFVVPEDNNNEIDSGTYVVGYQYGNDDDIDNLVIKVASYVHNHDLKAISDVYVDYPFNEITGNDNSTPLMRCFIRVIV